MKKFFSMMTVAMVCILMTACSTEIDQQCNKLADSVAAGHVKESIEIAEHIYAQKDDCTAGNLAELSLAYNFLTNQSNDNVVRYESAKRVIECYNAAMHKDADAARECYESAHVDMTSYAHQYEQMLPLFEAAIAADKTIAQDK